MKNDKLYIIIIIFIAAVMSIFVAMLSFGHLFSSAEFYKSTTDLMLVSQATTQDEAGSSDLEIECQGLNVVVLYKEGQVKEGKMFMDECGVSVFNCGPGTVDLAETSISWSLDSYASGTGSLGNDVLKPNDVKLLGCGEVFDAQKIEIDTDRFMIDKIPARVTLVSPSGTTWDEWEVTYITNKGLF